MNSTLCPYCSSTDTVHKAKAGKWECNSCEERFDAPASQFPSMAVTGDVSAKATQPRRIFFSYGHDANRELVDRFKEDLEKRGHQVWIDYKQIGTWDDWRGAITRGIHDSQLAVAFLSIHSTRDPGVCRNEIAMALHHFGTVYPVMVESVPPESIPATISHLQWPDLTQWRELREAPDPQGYERFYEEKLLEIISRVEGEATRFASESEVLRRVLGPSDFDSKFAQHLEGFTGRDWCFEALESWLNEQPDSRVFWVKAGPGFGKSALAVQIANRFRGAVVGSWFCNHQSAELSDPLRAVRTLAFQLALRWDDYRARLLPRLGLHAGSREEQVCEALEMLARKNLKDLFELLLAGPLAGLIWREHKLVILMDALDEVSREDEGRNELAALISREFLELPKWICFVVTSRPDALVSGHLQRFKPFEIAAEDGRNEADLRSYVHERILPLQELRCLPDAERARLTGLLVSKCAGMVLYLCMVDEGLKEGTLKPGQIETMKSGLAGLNSQYYESFERRFGATVFAETVQPLLRLVLAAPGPLPLALASEVLGIGKEETRQMRSLLGAYLVNGPKGMMLFHKTLGEWLTGRGSGRFYTDPKTGSKALGKRLWHCFRVRKKNDNGITKTLRWEAQVLEWLPCMLGAIGKLSDAKAHTNFARLLHERLKWDQAELHFRRALKCREIAYGPEHPDTLTSVKSLGSLLKAQGDYVGAEALYRRALEGREKALGAEHPSTLSSVNDLGLLLRIKGNYEGAEALCHRALEDREKVLGVEHPATLVSVHNLGNLLYNKGDYEGAEALYRRALDGREKALGVEHPSTLSSVNDLGLLLRIKGNYESAEALHRRALEGYEKALGACHPSTLISVNNLGRLLSDKGDYEGAEELLRRALEGKEKALGVEHPSTLNSVNNLGDLLRNKGDYEGAEALYRRALEGCEKALGVEHPDTLTVVKNLGNLLKSKGDYDSAEVLYRRALEGREKALGAEHPDTLWSVQLLASSLKRIKKPDEAAQILRRWYELFGASADAVRYNLACYECLSGNTEEAKRLIVEHLKLHPEMQDQALADEDFVVIKDFIASR